MRVSFEKKKEEAVRRMRKLGIIPQVIDEFKAEGTVEISEPPIGGLFYLNGDQKKIVKDLERNGSLVYLVVRSYTELGTMDSFLYVSDYEEEWEMDNEDIDCGVVMTYTYNYDMPECSEYGSIGFVDINGSILRTS